MNKGCGISTLFSQFLEYLPSMATTLWVETKAGGIDNRELVWKRPIFGGLSSIWCASESLTRYSLSCEKLRFPDTA